MSDILIVPLCSIGKGRLPQTTLVERGDGGLVINTAPGQGVHLLTISAEMRTSPVHSSSHKRLLLSTDVKLHSDTSSFMTFGLVKHIGF